MGDGCRRFDGGVRMMFNGDYVIGLAFAEFERALDRSEAAYSEIMVTDDREPVGGDVDDDETLEAELKDRRL